MGYTHYWKAHSVQTIPQPALTMIKKIVGEAHEAGLIQRDFDDPRAPLVAAEEICFNGAGDLGHETFQFLPGDRKPQFCKTGQKPYDEIVMKVLIALKYHLGENLKVSSDGNFDGEWREVRDYMVARFGIHSRVDQTLVAV